VFTHDHDPDAEYWTWAQVWRYLLVFHLYEDRTSGTGMIVDGGVFDATDDLQGSEYTEQAAPPVTAADALDYVLLGRPSAFNIDGLNLPEALIAVAEASGTRFWVRTELDEEAEVEEGDIPPPQDRLYIWARGAGEEVTFNRLGRTAGTADPRQILEDNDLAQLEVTVDYRDVLAPPEVLGDVRRYEVTMELVPGWAADANLDDVENVATAKAYAEAHWNLQPEELADDPWYQRYHPNGSLFRNYRAVGRRWIKNTSGRWPAADYAREGAPYTEDAYKLWEPSDCQITDSLVDETGAVVTRAVEPRTWAYRPRPLLPCFSADAAKRSLGIVLEFSFDSGSTWQVIPNVTARALEDDTGISIDAEDLSLIRDPADADNEEVNFWFGLIDGTARVRVTAVIEGDLRLKPNLNAALYGPPNDADFTRQFDVAGRYKSNRRDGGNSQFKTGGAKEAPETTFDGRDDAEDIQKFGNELLTQCTTRQFPGLATVPWLTTDFRPGQSVWGVWGLGLRFNTARQISQARLPDIVAVEYADGWTTIAIEDFRALERMGRA
jgi:hypothetical protein